MYDRKVSDRFKKFQNSEVVHKNSKTQRTENGYAFSSTCTFYSICAILIVSEIRLLLDILFHLATGIYGKIVTELNRFDFLSIG